MPSCSVPRFMFLVRKDTVVDFKSMIPSGLTT
jgi:hypothetical protein